MGQQKEDQHYQEVVKILFPIDVLQSFIFTKEIYLGLFYGWSNLTKKPLAHCGSGLMNPMYAKLITT